MKPVTSSDHLPIQQPIFKAIFDQCWDKLPIVLKKHYNNLANTNDQVVMTGQLDVMCKPPLLWLSPLLKLIGQMPARNEKNVAVSVCFQSHENTSAFHVNRTFHFKQGRPYVFRSKLLHVKENQVVELMRFGLGCKMRYLWDGEKIVLMHDGYVLRLFGYLLPLPLTFIFGEVYAEERAVDEHHFDMLMCIRHTLIGKIYEYKGRFEVSS